MLDFIADSGQRVMDEDALNIRTRNAKVRPALNAFGDFGDYDEAGNPTLVITGVSDSVDIMDDLRNDWGYATQTEERLHERGDDPTYDAAQRTWFNRKGDKVQFGTERRTYRDSEGVTYDVLTGWHSEAYGYRLTCWYCAYTFDALTFTGQDGVLTLDGMRHFVKEALLHTTECKHAHNGLPLIRMRDFTGKPVLRRASNEWGGRKKRDEISIFTGTTQAHCNRCTVANEHTCNHPCCD